MTDITDAEVARLQLERQSAALRDLNERLGHFVRIASHDLREPLNTIDGLCFLVQRAEMADQPQAVARFVPQIREVADRLRALLDDVLAYVRLDGAAAEPARPLDLVMLLDQVLATLHAAIERRGARIEVGPLDTVLGHRTMLALALQNLISNAVKFVPTSRAPRVRVSSMRTGTEVCVTIEDNGIGIPAERVDELGTPFKRLHAQQDFEGTGLGLAICRRIAEQHGGRLAIDSTPGQGSRFHLWLPAGR